MTRLSDAVSVDRSTEQARQGLERFLHSLRARDGISRLRLRVPMNGAAKHGLSLDRAVRIEAWPGDGASGRPDGFEIAWSPEGNTVFPRFEGSLRVSSNHDPHHATIELDGVYTPPFGAAGQVFDAAIGRQIAQTTAREFLADLKEAIEQQTP
jgi:hypothetical protein